jgi:hypothetical protein
VTGNGIYRRFARRETQPVAGPGKKEKGKKEGEKAEMEAEMKRPPVTIDARYLWRT